MAKIGKTRVLVLGGGLGGVSAALTLTATPALRERYEVTLVNHGWRLGGKGASGRNALQGQRIEEHGLHIFLGFYNAAFEAVRGAYAEWNKPADYAFQSWEDAFLPLYQVTLMQEIPRRHGPAWHPWNITLPPHPGTPGDGKPLHPGFLLASLLELLDDLIAAEKELPEALQKVLADGPLSAVRRHLETLGDKSPDTRWIAGILRDLQIVFQAALRLVLDLGLHVIPDALWDFLCAVDFGLALAIGYTLDVLPYGVTAFDRINGEDFRDWLIRHGLSSTFNWSGPVRLIYDMCFSYIDGQAANGPENARFAAGSAVEILGLMGFAYKGAPLWKMNAGMGDTVFTPFWFVLKQRGVDIRLFTRLHRLDVSENGNWVERIQLLKQVNYKNGEYDPFVKVAYGEDGQWLYCWPSEPNWDQIENGAALKAEGINFESVFCPHSVGDETLEVGKDFDLCVLAMPPAALAGPAAALSAADPRLRAMIETIPAVPTQAVQLWMRPDIKAMGWDYGPTAMTSYVEPLDSWGEMSHLLKAEAWKVDPPKAIEYLCGAVPWPELPKPYPCGLPARLAKDVEHTAALWLDANAGVLWPNTVVGGHFETSLVRSAYYRYNLDPSELYVQCFPGTIAARLPPGESGFVNAFLAGDWTRTWFSAGSADIAVLSGKQAAEAIARHPIDLTPPA
jgi:uncharacterized protein with NAD-binding domain and iron-sulfur cluster